MITVPSPEEILAARSPAGGWTKATLADWGVAWPPQKGWRRDLNRRWLEDYRRQKDAEAMASPAALAATLQDILGDRPRSPCPVCGETELIKGHGAYIFADDRLGGGESDDAHYCLVCDALMPVESWMRPRAVRAERREKVIAALLAAHPDEPETPPSEEA